MTFTIISKTHGQHNIIIDDEDWEMVKLYNWHIEYAPATLTYYVNTNKCDNNGKQHNLRLHRYLTNCPKDKMVDHINHDGRDNRKSNIRICTHEENQWNRYKKRNNNNRYKGVSKSKKSKKWRSYINVNTKAIYLGSYPDEISAAKAYNEAAIKYYGEFALINDLTT